MKFYDIVIAYDIADLKRLRRISKYLEKNAYRIQKSLFFYPKVTKFDIDRLKRDIEEIINKKEDDVRIYKVDVKKSISLQSGINLKSFNVVL